MDATCKVIRLRQQQRWELASNQGISTNSKGHNIAVLEAQCEKTCFWASAKHNEFSEESITLNVQADRMLA